MAPVPDGQGDFAKTHEYGFVGEGHGSWAKDVVEVPVRWRLRKCATALVVAFVALVAAGILCLVLGGGTAATSTVKSLGVADDADCSHGDLSPDEKDWCCANKGKLCPTTAQPNQFDCSKDRATWQTWPDAQKDWCCGLSRSHCEAVDASQDLHFDCDAGVTRWKTGWSADKKQYCCETFKRGCQSSEYDCDKDLDSWASAWSDMKIAWCCHNEDKGCKEGRSTSKSPFADERFDCREGAKNFKLGWTPEKKAWCCDKYSVACPHSHGCKQACIYKLYATSCYDRITWLRTHNASRMSEPCGWAHRQVMEECGDQCFGCTPENVGCPAPAEAVKPLYDCHHDLRHWQTKWHAGKQSWCCENEKRGCHQGPRCGHSFQSSWPHEKKEDCCLADPELKGCHEAGYTCKGSEADKWSKRQATFCCKADHKFCDLGINTTKAPPTTEAPTTSTTEPTTTTEAPTTTTDLGGPYDCIKGYSSWRTSWSDHKQKWCCKTKNLGCGDDD